MQEKRQMASRSRKPSNGSDPGGGPIQTYFEFANDHNKDDSGTAVFGEVEEQLAEPGKIGEPSLTGKVAGLGSEDSFVAGLRCFSVNEMPYSVVATPQLTALPDGNPLTKRVLDAARRWSEVEPEGSGGKRRGPEDSLDSVPVVLGSFGGGEDLMPGVLVEVSYFGEAVTWRRRGRVDVAELKGIGLVEVVRLFDDEIQVELDPEHVPVIDRALSNIESRKSLAATDVEAINLTMNTIDQNVIEVWQIDAVIALVIPPKDASVLWHIDEPAERLRRLLDILDRQEAPLPEARKLPPTYNKKLPVLDEILRRFDALPDNLRNEAYSKITSMYEGNKDRGRDQLTWIKKLPVPQGRGAVSSTDELAASLKNLRKQLGLRCPGMPGVVEYFIEHLAYSQACVTPVRFHPLLVGRPGVGKTKVAKEYALALGREFRKIDLGGLSDPQQLLGFHATYQRSEPGNIISAVASCETANPVILLDEIDKTGNTRGSVHDVFLSLLDPDNNGMFIDAFLDVPYDLSGVTWIATANSLAP
ncbi:AAA family ATPase, partial [Ferrimicrobium acidiphilum]|uniref:AAA family ATPase n=1 Tax=Ferrimicrobium acidiphilum TaxID=121039 RepID=UPI0023EFCDF3